MTNEEKEYLIHNDMLTLEKVAVVLMRRQEKLELLQKEYDSLQNKNQQLKEEINKLTVESTEWESEYYRKEEIIEKAKEYIKENRRADLVFKLYLNEDEVDNLLNILNGDDK